jgi:penicillin-binding protein 1A
VLAQNVARGTGTAAQIGRPQAGKTGTTDSFTDGWFTGYTPQLATSVWVGYPHSTVSMYSVHGITVYGGTFPAEIWHDFTQAALDGAPVLNWTPAHHWPRWQPWHGSAQWAGAIYGR